MIPEAACGAEREVKIVKGNESLEGCPTTPAAPGQEEDRWLNRYPRNFQSKLFPAPPAISGFVPEVFSEHLKSPLSPTAFWRTLQHSFHLPTPGPVLTEHKGLQDRASAGWTLPAGQPACALRPELSEGKRSLIKDKASEVDRVPKK